MTTASLAMTAFVTGTTFPTKATFVEGRSACSSCVLPDPLSGPFDAPFTPSTAPRVAHRSGDHQPNWDGTPAHSSGARGRKQVGADVDRWRQRRGIA